MNRLTGLILLYLALYFAIIFIYPVTSSEVTQENYVGERLVESIKRNTTKFLRPVRDARTNTTIFFRLILYQILDADSVQAKIHLNFWAEMLWYNQYISWNPEDHGGIVRIDTDERHIWIPDVIFFTQLSGLQFNEHFPAPPALFSDGLTLVLRPFKTELVCAMDVWYFPYDSQNCSFDVGSWAHLASEIDIRPKAEGAADLSFFQLSTTFELIQFFGTYVIYSDPSLEGNDTEFSCLTYHLAFKRKPTYYMMNVILPSILINFLCVFNFIIPCETGEKVGYGITVFLAQSVNLMVVSEMMPQGGNSVLGMFMVASILLIALSLLMQIMTMCMFFSNSKCRASPALRSVLGSVRVIVGPRYLLEHEQLALANRNVDKRPRAAAEPAANGTGPKRSVPDSMGLKRGVLSQSERGLVQNGGQGLAQRDAEMEENDQALAFARFGGKRMSINIPRPRKSSSYSATHHPMYHYHYPSPAAAEEQPFARKYSVTFSEPQVPLAEPFLLEFSKDYQLNEIEVMEEWKLLANILNRFNGIVFTFLLTVVLSLYAFYHAPPS